MNYLKEKAEKSIEGYLKTWELIGSDLRKAQLIDWNSIEEEKLMQLLPLIDSLDKMTTSLGMHSMLFIVLDAIVNPKEG